MLDPEDIEIMIKKKSADDQMIEETHHGSRAFSIADHDKHVYNKERRGSTAQSFIYYQGIIKSKQAKAGEQPKTLKDRFKNQFEDVESSGSEDSSSDMITSSEGSVKEDKNGKKDEVPSVIQGSIFGNYHFEKEMQKAEEASKPAE